MKNDFVMTKEDVDEMKAKAEDVKQTGIPSKLLVPTSYQLRTQTHSSEKSWTSNQPQRASNLNQLGFSEDSSGETYNFPDLLDLPTAVAPNPNVLDSSGFHGMTKHELDLFRSSFRSINNQE